MNFINFDHEGKFVIQNPALRLSGLDGEKILEMHTLDGAIVLLKPKMTLSEQIRLQSDVEDFANHLKPDESAFCAECRDCARKRGDTASEDAHRWDGADSEGVSVPFEAFEDAGILGEDLTVRSVEGAVIITAGDPQENEVDKIVYRLSQTPYDLAVLIAVLRQILKTGGSNA